MYVTISSFFLLVVFESSLIVGDDSKPTGRAEALEAYDCSGEVSEVSSISLNEVGECEDAPVMLEANSTVEIQLLQDSPHIEVSVSTCRMSVSRLIHHCGMHSHSTLVKAAHMSYIVELGRATCTDAIATRRLRWSGLILDDLQLGEETHSVHTIAGRLSTQGSCSGSSYADRFGSWSGVVVQAELRVFIDQYTTTANIRTGDITLRGGLGCDWKSKSCFDNLAGETYWEKKEDPSCPEKSYDVLYQGRATKVSSLNLGVHRHMYHIKSGGFQFVTQSGEKAFLCHQQVFTTDHPRLYIQERPSPGFYFRKRILHARNTDIMQYTNAKLTLLEHHIGEQLGQLFQKLNLENCETRRIALQSRLAFLKATGADDGMTSLGGRGTRTVVAGEAAHIIKCPKVRVQTRAADECYEELPITYDDKPQCVLPTSRIIVPSCTPTPCSDIIPHMWQIGRRWISLDPNPRVSHNPVVMDPTGNTQWEYRPLRELSIAGIYSTDQLERTQDVIMSSHTRGVVTSILTGRVTGSNPGSQDFRLDQVVPLEQLRNALAEAFGSLTAFMLEAGAAFGAVMLMYYTYQAVKALVVALLNFKMIKDLKGWSFWLLTAPCSIVTVWFQHKKAKSPMTTSTSEAGGVTEERSLLQPSCPSYPSIIVGTKAHVPSE